MLFVVEAIEGLYSRALRAMKDRFVVDGKVVGRRLNEEQLRAHGLAYLATEATACRQLFLWAQKSAGTMDMATPDPDAKDAKQTVALDARMIAAATAPQASSGEFERRIAAAYLGEVARSLRGGIDLGPCETVSLHELGLTDQDLQETILQAEVIGFSNELASAEAYGGSAMAALTRSGPGRLGHRGVDDDTAGRDALVELFRVEGFRVEAFQNGAEYISRAQAEPACTLLDVHMPGRSGLDILNLLNAATYPERPGM